LLRVVEETNAPIVFGSRNLATHWHRIKDFFAISIGVWGSTKFVNLLYGTHLTDAWTCYKLFSKEVSNKAHFIGNGFEADYLFIGEAAVQGFPIVEVAISHRPRTVEEGKKIRYKDGIHSMLLLLGHRLTHLRSNKNAMRGKEDRMRKIRPYLLADTEIAVPNADEHLSGVNWLKTFLKQFPLLYYSIWGIFCPVLMMQNGPKRLLRYTTKDSLIADIGSGPDRVAPQIINVDIFPFPGVDVVASADHLPFQDATFDGLVTESMLEHVANPKEVATELLRVLKPGGVVYASAPFIHPYHASPDDFNRFTTSGLKELFPGCEVIELGVRSGPWSAFLMFLAYWLGVVFSFGSRKTAPFLAHVFMLILGPLKIFDFFFASLPGAEAVSAHLYIIARKKLS
jgi:SAM-dependent methyltransferase